MRIAIGRKRVAEKKNILLWKIKFWLANYNKLEEEKE